jgi:succinyl-diaminopimelate desuccinylase
MTASTTLALAKNLIARPSVTPEDAGCLNHIMERLSAIGFTCERMDAGGVANLWARRGTKSPVFCFAGHTDVVPPGPREAWSSDPFHPEIREGQLYGRGAADMKSSIAAMVTACEDFVATHGKHIGSIAFLLTSDEEGPATHGTVHVIEQLEARGEKIDYCLVGEPTAETHVGDIVKNGRRGSLNGRLLVHGRQGHVAYPHKARNPIHVLAPALAELTSIEWDQGNDHFPPTTFQVSNLNAGTGATNVIPGTIDAWFNFRFSTEQTAEGLRARVEEVLARHDIQDAVEWNLSGNPFLTPAGALVTAARVAVQKVTGLDTQLSTSGGTSDGRFIAPTGAQVLELGPINASIHQVNEHIDVAQLDTLHEIYQAILNELLNS